MLFLAHIAFVVHCTFDGTPIERLQLAQHPALYCSSILSPHLETQRKIFVKSPIPVFVSRLFFVTLRYWVDFKRYKNEQ